MLSQRRKKTIKNKKDKVNKNHKKKKDFKFIPVMKIDFDPIGLHTMKSPFFFVPGTKTEMLFKVNRNDVQFEYGFSNQHNDNHIAVQYKGIKDITMTILDGNIKRFLGLVTRKESFKSLKRFKHIHFVPNYENLKMFALSQYDNHTDSPLKQFTIALSSTSNGHPSKSLLTYFFAEWLFSINPAVSIYLMPALYVPLSPNLANHHDGSIVFVLDAIMNITSSSAHIPSAIVVKTVTAYSDQTTLIVSGGLEFKINKNVLFSMHASNQKQFAVKVDVKVNKTFSYHVGYSTLIDLNANFIPTFTKSFRIESGIKVKI